MRYDKHSKERATARNLKTQTQTRDEQMIAHCRRRPRPRHAPKH